MELAQQLQIVVGEVQTVRQQIASLNAQVRELEGTIVAVKKQPEELSLHRQMGSILIEVEDREQLMSDLKLTLDQMSNAFCLAQNQRASGIPTARGRLGKTTSVL